MLAEAVEKIMQSQLDFFWAHPKVVKMVLHALADSDKKNGISDIFHEIGHRRDEIIRDTVRKAVALTPDCKKFTEDQIDAVCFQVNALTLNFLVASAVEKKNVYTTAMLCSVFLKVKHNKRTAAEIFTDNVNHVLAKHYIVMSLGEAMGVSSASSTMSPRRRPAFCAGELRITADTIMPDASGKWKLRAITSSTGDMYCDCSLSLKSSNTDAEAAEAVISAIAEIRTSFFILPPQFFPEATAKIPSLYSRGRHGPFR